MYYLYSNSKVTNNIIPYSEVLFDGYAIAHKSYKDVIMLFTAVMLCIYRIVHIDIVPCYAIPHSFGVVHTCALK